MKKINETTYEETITPEPQPEVVIQGTLDDILKDIFGVEIWKASLEADLERATEQLTLLKKKEQKVRKLGIISTDELKNE